VPHHPLPPLLHNRPERIAAAVESLVVALRPRYPRLAIAYADCGTYGALDEVCDRHGLPRLRGAHCYDVFAGPSAIEKLMDEEPGTYLLTDYLVQTFHRSVVTELGLDRHPDLRDAYFAHYRRVVWLAQHPTTDLHEQAARASKALGLPLTILPIGDHGLELELKLLCEFHQHSE
jgi:hypothetical protein